MFDVSFSELFVIAVVALLVVGPEKLPKVARTVGAFMGRMQRYVAQVKEEVNREVRFEELQKLQEEIKQSVENDLVNPVEREMSTLKDSLHKPLKPTKIKTTASKPETVALESKVKPVAKKRASTLSKQAVKSSASKSNKVAMAKTPTKTE
ncbi:MAG TPA: Sec-independent protein translocase protein TatB [Methylotenera sp.]|nr:Sec-independent protein translocase protein TatB [Methylotenera sp.]